MEFEVFPRYVTRRVSKISMRTHYLMGDPIGIALAIPKTPTGA